MSLTRAQIEAIAISAAKESVYAAAREAARTAAMDPDDLRDIVAEAVKQTLTRLGVDHSRPMEMQQDFQALRMWRESAQQIRSKTILGVLGVFGAGLVALVIMMAKDWARARGWIA